VGFAIDEAAGAGVARTMLDSERGKRIAVEHVSSLPRVALACKLTATPTPHRRVRSGSGPQSCGSALVGAAVVGALLRHDTTIRQDVTSVTLYEKFSENA
jgi:hypothetical protein